MSRLCKSLTLLATALLAACAVGPDYVRPQMDVPATFARVQSGESADAGRAAAVPAADARFWQGFADPLLDQLVEHALRENHDLRIALANYDRANALLRGTRFDLFPTATAGAQAARQWSSADQMPGVARRQREVDSVSAQADLGWELDLFGRLRRQVEAARADTLASAADLQAAQVAIVADVIGTYLELRSMQLRLQVARDNAGNQRQTLQLVQARQDAGRGTGFDTARARAQLEATQGRVPALELEVAQREHRLAVLTGRPAQALIGQLGHEAALPSLPRQIDLLAPGAMLRRRPDVAAAEARLHAATAKIGVATADLFPRLTLGGLIGRQAADAGALFEAGSQTRVLALGIDWSFLDIGRVRARIDAADADARGHLARYQRSVLLALEDAENALVGYTKTRDEDAHLQRAAEDGARAAQLARVRLDAGNVDLLDVLDAERVRLQAQDAAVDARARSLAGAVAVFRAMAGGWPELPQRVSLNEVPPQRTPSAAPPQ